MMFFRVMLSAALGSGVAQAEGPSQIHLAYGDQLDTNGSVSSVSLAGAYHKTFDTHIDVPLHYVFSHERTLSPFDLRYATSMRVSWFTDDATASTVQWWSAGGSTQVTVSKKELGKTNPSGLRGEGVVMNMF